MERKLIRIYRKLFILASITGVLLGTIYFHVFYWKQDGKVIGIYYSIFDVIKQIRINKEVLYYTLLIRLKQFIVFVLIYMMLPIHIFIVISGLILGFVFGCVCCLQVINVI